MGEPIVFVVDEDPQALAALSSALQRRFGADYQILADGDCSAAEERLAEACDGGAEVALVVATSLLADRAQFFRDIPAGPFYGFNRSGVKVSQGIIDNWWRQGMMCGVKAAYDCIKAFSETDFTEDLEKIDVPTLIMHGDDDQVVPLRASAMLSSKLIKNAQLKVYAGFDHGMSTTHHDVINADLLAFFKA